ncbi:MAG: sterol desaturase family protein [Pseudomonadales bacterium]
MDFPQASEVFIRVVFFVGIFAALAALEHRFPRRARLLSRWKRWPSNLGVSLLNQAFIRMLVPATAVALAVMVEDIGFGLLGRIELAWWLEVVIALLLLDLAVYLQHRLYHTVPLLWRFHRMHHADTEFDVSTGIRFHPLSVLLSAFIKLSVVFLVGPSAFAVVVFEILLNATSLFNHSNFKLPITADRIARMLVVTPDMHRVHHSTNVGEMNTNFGFNFPWWDHFFRTYRAQPGVEHDNMLIGLGQFRAKEELRLDRMLTQPFRVDVIDLRNEIEN